MQETVRASITAEHGAGGVMREVQGLVTRDRDGRKKAPKGLTAEVE